jgi:hypothetical protein
MIDTNISNKINRALLKESGGANIHFRGYQDMGKTMCMVRFYQHLVDAWGYSPNESVGNLHIGSELTNTNPSLHYGGKYGTGYQALKGDDLRQYLWDMTHKPYRHRIVMIDEIDSEFPARMFQSREQTEIMLRLWHNKKLRNFIMYTSHLGEGTDLILRLATNFEILPHGIDWINNCIPITVINALDGDVYDAEVPGVNEAIENYDRWEMTEKTEEDSEKQRPLSKAQKALLKETDSEGKLRSGKEKFNSIKRDSGQSLLH